MPKIGPEEEGAYDPFNKIADSLTALSEQPEGNVAQHGTAVIEPPTVAQSPGHQHRHDDDQKQVEQGASKTRGVSPASTLSTTKRFKTTREEALRIEQSVLSLSAELGIPLDASKVTRALWDAYLRHEQDILRNVPKDETWERPATYDAIGLAELDRRLANLINEGLMVACRRPTNTVK